MNVNTYKEHWDQKFRGQEWGKYPPEELVKFIARNYYQLDRGSIKILEIGCGPGANLWYLHREGFHVYGIDGSSRAIELADSRLAFENKDLNPQSPVLKAGDFSKLPWNDEEFDIVIDIFALYANTRSVISSTVNEIHRVLKVNGKFFTMLWGTNCTGYGTGIEIEPYTYDEITEGCCKNMGISHFFDFEEIQSVFPVFKQEYIDIVTRTDSVRGISMEEYVCQFVKSV